MGPKIGYAMGQIEHKTDCKHLRSFSGSVSATRSRPCRARVAHSSRAFAGAPRTPAQPMRIWRLTKDG